MENSMTAFEKLYSRKWVFFTLFTLTYFLTLSGLTLLGLSPFSSDYFAPTTNNPSGSVAIAEGELPVRIEIPSIGVRANVANPQTTDVASLDQALLSGAVRYPGSGVPGEEGNVLVFGHSSYLPVVHNKAYKAFNDIQKLEKGAPIFVIGESKVFVYAVETVEEANTSTGEISLAVDGAKLTLATCDTFGSKSDRFIVTAKLVAVNRVPTGE